jgi:DNA-binding NarL/FixJ family response regulator
VSQGQASGKLLKVYLVEDSPALRERLEAMLATIPGACIIGFASGAEEAVRGIAMHEPHVVVLDLKLAQGSGYDVLRALSGAAPQPGVYVLSNFATDQYRRAAAQLGARGFFDKTHEFELLREALAGLSA